MKLAPRRLVAPPLVKPGTSAPVGRPMGLPFAPGVNPRPVPPPPGLSRPQNPSAFPGVNPRPVPPPFGGPMMGLGAAPVDPELLSLSNFDIQKYQQAQQAFEADPNLQAIRQLQAQIGGRVPTSQEFAQIQDLDRKIQGSTALSDLKALDQQRNALVAQQRAMMFPMQGLPMGQPPQAQGLQGLSPQQLQQMQMAQLQQQVAQQQNPQLQQLQMAQLQMEQQRMAQQRMAQQQQGQLAQGPSLQGPTPQQLQQIQMMQQGQPMQALPAQGQGVAQMPMVPGNLGFPAPPMGQQAMQQQAMQPPQPFGFQQGLGVAGGFIQNSPFQQSPMQQSPTTGAPSAPTGPSKLF